jgi:hypothetical protein
MITVFNVSANFSVLKNKFRIKAVFVNFVAVFQKEEWLISLQSTSLSMVCFYKIHV